MSTTHENTPIKHTPGPWRADWNGLGEAYNIASTAPGQVLNMAEVHSFHDEDEAGPTAEATANANLIAAAPELLSALKGLLTHCGVKCSEWMTSNPDGSPRAITDPLAATARAAIAKAEGK